LEECVLHTANELKLRLHIGKAVQSIKTGGEAASTNKCCLDYAASGIHAKHSEALEEAVKLHEHGDS